jgi:hypothetical protein
MKTKGSGPLHVAAMMRSIRFVSAIVTITLTATHAHGSKNPKEATRWDCRANPSRRFYQWPKHSAISSWK